MEMNNILFDMLLTCMIFVFIIYNNSISLVKFKSTLIVKCYNCNILYISYLSYDDHVDKEKCLMQPTYNVITSLLMKLG